MSTPPAFQPAYRRATPEDWEVIRQICCATANAGGPIDPARWPFFGDLWVEPYERLAPEWCTVALHEGRVVAYLTGCPDTHSFGFRKFWLNDLPFLCRIYLQRPYPFNSDTRRFTRRFFRMDPLPEHCFSSSTQKRIRQDYPAHLHVNAIAECRGSGVGRHLIEHYQQDLLREGVRGIHLYCGQAPVGFYEKCGFEILEKIEFSAAKIPIFAMGRIWKDLERVT